MAGEMEKIMNGVGKRMVEKKKRGDRADRVLKKMGCNGWRTRISEREDRGREERLLILEKMEKRLEDYEKKRQVRDAAIDEALANLKERVGSGEDRKRGE